MLLASSQPTWQFTLKGVDGYLFVYPWSYQLDVELAFQITLPKDSEIFF